MVRKSYAPITLRVLSALIPGGSLASVRPEAASLLQLLRDVQAVSQSILLMPAVELKSR
jgi:hypothetical protein